MYFVLRDVLLNGAPAGVLQMCCGTMRFIRVQRVGHIFWESRRCALASAKELAAETEVGICADVTLRGIPQLYYGDESAWTGGGDSRITGGFPWRMARRPRNAFTEEDDTRAAGNSLRMCRRCCVCGAKTYGAERRETVASFFR